MTGSPATDEPVATIVARAIAAQQAGRLDEAEAQYRAVLTREPRQFEALHMLALVHAQRGRLDEAEALIGRAIAVAPDHAAAHFNRGTILLQRGQLAAALASYERAIALDPAHADACCNRGLVLDALGRLDEAVASYGRAIAIAPANPLAHTNRGNVLAKLDRLPEALASHERAVALAPGYADGWYNRANTLFKLGRAEAAVESYDRAIALNPQAAQPWCNRGLALDWLGRTADAVASFDRAVALDPRNAEAPLNAGNILLRLGRSADALASYDRVIAVRPTSAEAWTNRGIACVDLARFDDAIASFARSVALAPDDAIAHRHLAIARLTTGDLAGGFREYEWRWRTPAFRPRAFAQPRWSGDAELAGKTILLYGEQGLGDAIQFCRYVPLVARAGAQVIVEAAPALAALMGTLAGVAQVVAAGSPLPPFDLHCPLMSLPHAFGTTLAGVPGDVPYLSAPPARVAAWNARLAALPHPRIGLAWAGNPQFVNDLRRSIALTMLQPLLSGTPASFVSLQKDLRPGDAELLAQEPRIVPLGDELATFDDTAAAMMALDLVISVDTSIVHLAGALARPTWVLLPFSPDWRWLVGRDDSPWYPTARLFRQPARDDWGGVIARIAAELGRL